MSDSRVRADVICQFHERGDEDMVEVLAELEADDLRWQVIDELRESMTATRWVASRHDEAVSAVSKTPALSGTRRTSLSPVTEGRPIRGS
jgi:hypothetical protein